MKHFIVNRMVSSNPNNKLKIRVLQRASLKASLSIASIVIISMCSSKEIIILLTQK